MKNLIKILIVAILIKLSYFTFALLVNEIGQTRYRLTFESYISTLKKNDAYWYERIAEAAYPKIENKEDIGYHKGSEFKQSEWAFFPLYPLLIRYVAQTLNSGTDLSFLIISLITSLLSFWFFFLFLKNYLKNTDKALFMTYLIMLFPFHFYFSVFYTESLFFLLLIGGFYALLKKQYFWFSLLTMPLVLLRPNGIIMLIPMYIFMLEQTAILKKWSIKWIALFSRENIVRSLFFVPALVVFVGWGIYQYSMTNEFFAFSIAQQGWYRDFMFPLLSFFRHGDVATQFNSIYTILFVLLAIYGWKKFSLSLNIFIWISLLLPLTSGSVLSMQRFISIIFPFMIIIGNWIYPWKYKYVFLIVLFCIQLFTYYFWLIGHPISF